MVKIDFASLREHHLTAAHYEQLRAMWYGTRGQPDKALRCTALARHHRQAAEDALIGINREKQLP